MKPTKFSALCLAALLSVSCGTDYQKGENSVVVNRGDKSIEVTVIDSAIVRVQKSLIGVESKESPDFATVLDPQPIAWSVAQKGEDVVINLPKLNVLIDKDGEVSYTSTDGKELLSETSTDTFIKDTTAYHSVSQAFVAGDEALYGLGQYQSGRMNWRNVPVRMMQYNQEIAVPVLVSTKGYTLYWNNYSVTDFNYPDNEITFTQTTDETLNIRTAKFTPTKSGVYNFFMLSEPPAESNRRLGLIHLTLNGETVIYYDTNWYPDSYSGDIELTAGVEYEVVLQDTKALVESRLLYTEPDFDRTVFSSDCGEQIDYYFVGGENPNNSLQNYSKLTGFAPMFPKKAYGFWQCKEISVPKQEDIMKSATEYRKRNIPVDYIVNDWNYWISAKGPEWDRSRYPDPQGLIKELDDMNLGFMISVWPEVVNKALQERYGLDKSMLTGCSYVDFFDLSTHEKYYEMLSDSMFKIGVKGIWLDGSEPIRQPDQKHQTPFGTFDEVTNAYALLMSKAMYEGGRKTYPNQRVHNLTRSAFAGQQRYGHFMWSGDIKGSWEQLDEQITAGLNFTMTGIPYWTTDIGGYFRGGEDEKPFFTKQYTDPNYRELLARWFEYGAFCPIFRIHGYKTETEVWNYGAEFEQIARKYIDLRYQLMPYIYSTAKAVTDSGFVLMSPLPYHYPNDSQTWEIEDQFFFGESLMICPVTKYEAREREVYLPQGEWYNFWSNERIAGGRTITAAAPLDQMPIFVKGGSIIPYGPKIQYATEPTSEPTVLKIYPGKDGEFTLYYDDDSSYDYENGVYSEIVVSYSESEKSVTLESSHDEFVSFAKSPKSFVVELVCSDSLLPVSFDGGKITVRL
ncbi:MAG: glycoside hydrolase family 31 protein [Rikenellaceae bacterium]